MIFGLISVFLNALAQLAIKKATQFGSTSLTEYIKNPYLYATGFLYATSILLWFAALSRLNLTVAYPLQALGYVIVSTLAVVYFGEKMTAPNWLGIILILIGVLLTQVAKN